ncbi:MAG: hypothetical protein IH914_00060 [candidate division Zixibacteria bacterium]|nr:hypothetical protein [candidate division Zixibacteria bacterium]
MPGGNSQTTVRALRARMRFYAVLVCALTLIHTPDLLAQTAPDPADTLSADSATLDSALLDPSAPDSSEFYKFLLDADKKLPPIEPFRFNMLAASLLLRSEQSARPQIDRAFYHDAGDFLRADRSFFTVDYQSTPIRHTVSPFGLAGPRTSVIFDGRNLLALEHLPEQDGLMDFNDAPTASVSDVYSITGPQAAFLGGNSGVAGVWMQKLRASGHLAESRLEVQKGTFGYAYTKGILTEKLDNGFAYTAALGYRKADFFALLSRDDAYHQFWELEAPLDRHWRLTNSLRLYRRIADYLYRSITARQDFSRRRRDRDFVSRLEHTPNDKSTFAFEFRHQRSESTLEDVNVYKLHTNQAKNTFSMTRDQRFDNSMISVSASVTRSTLELEPVKNSRNEWAFSFKALLYHTDEDSNVRPGLYGEAGLAGSGGFSALPRVNAGWTERKGALGIDVAVGVTPVFPRQYELDLRFESPVALGGDDDIDQRGSPDLQPERQYTAAAKLSLGSGASNISLSATGGFIVDGINWRSFAKFPVGREFRPINEDVRFGGLTAASNLELTDWLHWVGSGSLYSISYESTDAPAYTPKYNMFSGMTLDIYLPFLDLYLSGYGELALTGPYTGLDSFLLGEDPVASTRISARIKSFRFHYVFENSFNRIYEAREQFLIPGRYSWYWITWDFLD